VTDLAWSPREPLLVVSTTLGLVFFDESGRVLRTIDVPAWVNAIAFTPDGQRLVAATDDGSAYIYSVSDGRLLQTLPGHGTWVTGVAASQTYIATGDEQGRVRLWDAASGARLQDLGRHSGQVRQMAFSPNGTLLAAGDRPYNRDDRPGRVKVWRLPEGRLLYERRLQRSIGGLAFSPDGRYLAVSYGTTVALWEATTGQEALRLQGHRAAVQQLAFSPDGRYLASVAGDRTVRVWEVPSGTTVHVLSGPYRDNETAAVAFSHDGRYLAAGGEDPRILLWEMPAGRQIRELRDAYFDESRTGRPRGPGHRG